MNWLGASPLSMLGAVFGALLGALAFGHLHVLGYELPLCVGVSAGVGCALSTSETNVMRGLVVGTIAAWVGAAAHAVYVSKLPLLHGVGQFHQDLTPLRFALHIVSIVFAVVIGGTSFRRRAHARIAGS